MTMDYAKYSTFWPRFWAGMVDGLIFIPLPWIYNYTFAQFESNGLRVLLIVINSCAFVIYEIWMHARYGQTVGKMLCGVKVLDVSEKPLSLRQAILRDSFYLVLLPIGIIQDISRTLQGIDISKTTELTELDRILLYPTLIWGLIELVTMLTNRKRRALHDFIAGSVVVRV